MEQVEALEPEDALSAPGEVIERGASHPADSDHDDVVPIHGPDPSRGWLNGPVSTAVESLGENRVRLTVDVSPDQVQHAVEHALSDLSESVKIPGFRKGKIPKPVLVSRLGKERIYAEAVDSHIGGWFWSSGDTESRAPGLRPGLRVRASRHGRRSVELHRDGRGAGAPRARRLDDARSRACRDRGAAGRGGRRGRGVARVGRRARAGGRSSREGGRHAPRRSPRLRRRGPAGHGPRAGRRAALTRARGGARRRVGR